jgi:hypothetical protein
VATVGVFMKASKPEASGGAKPNERTSETLSFQ